ncbi:hypothetical protein DICPUDRAFT_81895 [Dictyostelium purpureum]|uniref:VTT domain-containing protein n=1 Tax=Dictyostelium purpureum TaxID=5786 RepID=F0ZUX0_DICPU|nr:uncharacterized protein DICPUDRAFT_81895 [Dictyostelium purpureum]EGC32247.1 hypothetical protein DICPUDRAFT_81895 [Dictyostelium purpureum]|eukprot:XP_003291214.1 hypothetical protein DICPUDRAFT_81895 [Dictyostelium purpureum]
MNIDVVSNINNMNNNIVYSNSSNTNNNNTNNNNNSNINNSTDSNSNNNTNTKLESKIKISPNTTINKKNIYRIEGESEPLPIWLLVVFFAVSITVIVFLFLNFPNLSEEHKQLIRLPQSFKDVKVLSDILSKYTKDNYFIVITTFGVIYTFLQAFSIPGSVFLSFLSGGLFGLKVQPLSYLISYYIGRNMVRRLFPDKLKLFSESISQRRDNLFNYIIFLRITPFLPNWFINLASPLLDVPISTFAIGTFIGIMPATFLAVKAGISIQNISKPTDIFDLKSILSMGILATLSILPTLQPVRNRLDKLLNRKKDEPKSN